MKIGAMDRANYGTRAYTAKLNSAGDTALTLNPEGIPAARFPVEDFESPAEALAAAEEKARQFNRTILRG